MNKEVKSLDDVLYAMTWEKPKDMPQRSWLLLWVTSKPIHVNAKPHENLLWVGKDEFEKHVPVLGRRALVTRESDIVIER